MLVLSIWQPYASLAIHGFKMNETRGWKAPASLIGQRFAIAATKGWLPAQRALVADPAFREAYAATGLPDPETLPRGCVLGSATLASCDLITDETLEDITPAEALFGDYRPGRYAWRLRAPQAFGPYYARGQQGLWRWEPPNDVAASGQDNRDPKGTPTIGRALHPALRQAGVPGA